ncbi:MAG: putative pyridoxal kinase [Thelocarpon impressellum]|nr:MAG: putative pyridoxal kinase [Thelocarpon impressellum]
MAALVMQTLGCDVAALNTVQFSNHKGYRQVTGTKATASEIRDLYDGLARSSLDDFDVLLSGYLPGAAAVEAVGSIARDLRLKCNAKPGSFFWVLDPVMGDQGQLYVDADVLPAYKSLVHDADLVLPNQFEAELLSEIPITSMDSLAAAISTLHAAYRIPHIVVTSVRFSAGAATLSVVGSTARADHSPRLFKIEIPAIPCFFSGTGDMFAALTVARLRAAVAASTPDLTGVKGWVSPDEVPAVELPLAKAVERVLASMQTVLSKTKQASDAALAQLTSEELEGTRGHLARTKAAEVRLVRNLEDLKHPDVDFAIEALEV